MTLEELKLALSNKPKADHPNIIKNGKVHFWSLTRKEYVKSACQPRGKK